MDSAAITQALEKYLDLHGFGFQYAVLATAAKAFNPDLHGGSPWRLPIAEFPVEIQGTPYHIDFILQHCRRPMLLVAECKRANPALRNWCFLRAPFRRTASLSSQVFVEELAWRSGDELGWRSDDLPFCRLKPLFYAEDDIYHLGVELKSNEKGDPCDKGRGGMDEAATQVMRGANGLVEFVKRSPAAHGQRKTLQFLPVIFTTARIWVTSADLATADILTGKLALGKFPVEERPWVYIHYAQSAGLKHSLRTEEPGSEGNLMLDALCSEYVRTIAVVNAGAIEQFLRSNNWI
jgi:hypothetical protein